MGKDLVHLDHGDLDRQIREVHVHVARGRGAHDRVHLCDARVHDRLCLRIVRHGHRDDVRGDHDREDHGDRDRGRGHREDRGAQSVESEGSMSEEDGQRLVEAAVEAGD